MLIYVCCKGVGASRMRKLFSEAMEEVKTHDEKASIGHIAFMFWPRNFTQDGSWKNVSEFTEEEVDGWKAKQRRN
jgi:hypothetical protein